MCLWKKVVSWFQNTQAQFRKMYEIITDSTIQTWFKATSLRSILRKYTSNHSEILCAYNSGNDLPENRGGRPSKCMVRGQKSIWNHPCSMPHFKAYSPQIYIRSFRNFWYLYLRAWAVGISRGSDSENSRIVAKNPFELPLELWLDTHLKATFKRTILEEYVSDHTYSSSYALLQKWWLHDSKMHGYR